MKFYIITNDHRETACVLSLAEAKTIAATWDGDPHIKMEDIDVTTENMRRILGDLGGYVNEVKHY